jgi:hypothetical protein
MKWTVIGGLTTLAAGLAPGEALAQRLSANEIVRRAVEAQGGRTAWSRHRSLEGRGTVEVLGGYVGPYQVWRWAPNRLRTSWNITVIRHDLGYDGTQGWERALTVRELPPLDLARVERRAAFNPLLQLLDARTPMALAAPAGDTLAVRFAPASGLAETFYFDPRTYLPARVIRQSRYEEGLRDVVTTFGEWRRVDDIVLPHAIEERLLELPLSIRIHQYQLDRPIEGNPFSNPKARMAGRPYGVSLATIPRRIYKQHDGGEPADWRRFWGIPFGPTESWLVNIVVREDQGRQVTPDSARVVLFAGSRPVKTMSLSAALLAAGTKYPVARFHPQDEIFHIRHHFTEHAELGIDRMAYTLMYHTPNGRSATAELSIPVSTYRTRTSLIVPIKGEFMATTGQEFYELGHKYEWSQQFSWDLIGLGKNLEVKRPNAAGNEAWVTYGRELVAPGDGIVVYARNDVPDMMPPRDYLKLAEPQYAIGGNSVLIDHGNGEVSCLFHMQQGSVRVKRGERVRQGQVVGRIGSSGSPGAPHVHYQLQAGADLFGADGLPVQFTNVERIGWLGGPAVLTPVRGVFLVAK